MEMADLLVITKADGSNTDHAKRAASEYSSALHMFPVSESGWAPSVLTCSAMKNEGMEQIWQNVLDYKKHTKQSGYFDSGRKKQSLFWMNETISNALNNHFYGNSEIQKQLSKLRDDVLQNRISSFIAAQQILDSYFHENKQS